MIFFAYLIAAGVYLLITLVALFYVPRRFKEKRQKLVAFLASLAIFVLAPAGWIYYERSYFDSLCDKEAGVKVFRTAERVEGFYLVDSRFGNVIQDYQFNFVETKDHDGKFYRYSVGPNSQVKKQRVESLKSRYGLSEVRVEEPGGIVRHRYQVIELGSNQMLGSKTYFDRGQSWLKPWLTSKTCHGDGVKSITAFLNQVLKP